MTDFEKEYRKVKTELDALRKDYLEICHELGKEKINEKKRKI